MVDNAHEFLKKLIEPIAKKCSFLIDGPHMFKEKFLPKCKNFDSDKYEILSFDATKLYTSVNTNRVISEILKIIYKNPTVYFKDKDEDGRPLPHPERANFRKFMHNVLLNFNTFESQLGIFKQRSGLAMGSSLSPSLSNIFLDLVEKSIIPKFLKSKKVLSWVRYADDIICICEKNSVDEIFNKLNTFDHRLKFTIQRMENKQIKFLDCLIFIEDSEVKFRKIFKKGLDTVFTNYQHDISPLKYKHNIFTQLHRTRDCCSDAEQFEKSLEDLRIIYSKNSYPSWLIEQKIGIFLQNDKKPPRAEKFHTFCLDYNSHRVDFYAKQLIKKLKTITPDICINLCYRSRKISQLYSYTFKPIQQLFNTSNCVYKFQCYCSYAYIGQCRRMLKDRAREHKQPSKSLGILDHMLNCETYKTRKKQFMEDFKDLPKPLKLTELQKENEFYKSHYSILQKTSEMVEIVFGLRHTLYVCFDQN